MPILTPFLEAHIMNKPVDVVKVVLCSRKPSACCKCGGANYPVLRHTNRLLEDVNRCRRALINAGIEVVATKWERDCAALILDPEVSVVDVAGLLYSEVGNI